MATITHIPEQQISTIDALWALIQSQKMSVRKALLKRFMDDEAYADETSKQKTYICNTIEKGWMELKKSVTDGTQLKSADELLDELNNI